MFSSSPAYDVDESHVATPSTIVNDSLSVICYNMRGTKSDTDHEMICSLLHSKSPDIMILQEPRWVPKMFITEIEQASTYKYVGKNKEVGILYKHQRLQYIDEIPLPGVFDETIHNFIHTNSICVKFKHISHGYEILVVSYHSPVTGIDENIRMDAINAMFEAVVDISHSFNPSLPIIGGADMNLDLYRVSIGQVELPIGCELILPDDLILHSEYVPTERRTVPVIRRPGRPHLGKIDYFFHYPSKLGLVMEKVMDVVEHSILVEDVFDTFVDMKIISNHDPLIATMINNIKTCFENLLIEKPNFSVWEDDKDDVWDVEKIEEDEFNDPEYNSDYDGINIDNSDSDSDSDCDSDNDTDIDDEDTYHGGRIIDSDGMDSDGEYH